MTKPVLVAIHGVGDAAPGSVLLEISRGIAAANLSAARKDLVIDGVQYPRMTVEHPEIAEIIEVNWSDVARPSANTLGVLGYLARIVVALLSIATAGVGDWTVKPASLYRACFEGLLVYCIYPPLIAMLGFVAAPYGHAGQVAAGLAGLVVVACFTCYLQRFSRAFAAGWVWAGVIAIGTVAVASDAVSASDAVRIATFAYVWTQAAASAALFLALVSCALRRGRTWDQRIATMGLLYFPFFIVSAIGALLWAAALWGAALAGAALGDPGRVEEWRRVYGDTLDEIGYDLALVEFTFAGMVAFVALGLLVVAAVYFYRARKPAEPSAKTAGQFARDGGRTILAAGAVTFIVLCLVYAWSYVQGNASGGNHAALEVYSYSALRFVPYVPLVIGPLSIVSGIAVDVLFYIVPLRRLSTARELRGRLRAVLDHVHATGAPVFVWAHSQGTVIAIDVVGRIASYECAWFVTAGSPLESLYARFLANTPETRGENDGENFRPPPRWMNFCREGDYLGAAQARPTVEEINLGPGGHTGYWRLGALWRTAFERRGRE